MEDIALLKKDFCIAYHGGGVYGGCFQTNSKESIEYWYSKGGRVFELDVAEDSGEVFLLAHHLKIEDLLRCELTNIPSKVTSNWFLQQRLFPISTEGLTPLSLHDLIFFVTQYEDCICMLDLWGNDDSSLITIVQRIKGCLEDLHNLWDNFIFEIYDLGHAELLRRVQPNVHIIFGCSFDNVSCTISPRQLLDHGIEYVSCPWNWIKNNKSRFELFAHSELTVFSFTHTNLKSFRLKAMGVSVNIVDYCFNGLSVLYKFPLYLLSGIKNAMVSIYVKCKYFGVKGVIFRVTKKLLR